MICACILSMSLTVCETVSFQVCAGRHQQMRELTGCACETAHLDLPGGIARLLALVQVRVVPEVVYRVQAADLPHHSSASGAPQRRQVIALTCVKYAATGCTYLRRASSPRRQFVSHSSSIPGYAATV